MLHVKTKESKVFRLFLALFMVVTLLFNQSHVASASIIRGSNSGYFTGGFKRAVGIQIRCGAGSSAFMDTAKSKWNGISSKVSITTATGDYVIWTYFNSDKPPTQGDYGTTKRYNGSKLLDKEDTSSNWTKANCYQYTHSALNTDHKKKKVCVHEVGHAISVAHPLGTPAGSPPEPDCVMKQGIRDNCSLSTYDKASLKAKWGN